MSRQENIDRIIWLDENSGTGFGVCSIASMFLQNSMQPSNFDQSTGRYADDWKANVAVIGSSEKYTDEELQILADFSERSTARYDKMFEYRMVCNLIIIDRHSERQWLRKRQTWDIGSMFSPSLDAAIKVFERE